jgi:hypothetical protein
MIPPTGLTPETNAALLDVSAVVKKTSLEPGMVELVELRASLIRQRDSSASVRQRLEMALNVSTV